MHFQHNKRCAIILALIKTQKDDLGWEKRGQ